MPSQAEARADQSMTELEAAHLVARGELPSPTAFGDMTLMALRITGTGLAFRAGLKEYVWRDPAIFTSNEFLQRCVGLPVIWEHPDAGVLNSDEFASRAIGACMFAWVQGSEVWTVARLYDREAVAALASGLLSTSPAVAFTEADGNATLNDNAGTTLLIEGRPALLSHLAICERGVWDKAGPPAGVRADESKGTSTMDGDMTMTDNTAGAAAKADPPPAAAQPDPMSKLMQVLDSMCGKLDGVSKRLDALEATGAQRATAETIGRPTQVAADGMLTTGTEREEFRREEDLRRGAAMAKLGEESLKREQEFNKQLAEAQSRADKALIEFGQRAEMPMRGETVSAYRRRMLRPLKQYCSDYKDVNIDGIDDPKMLDIIEGRIYGDAVEAARNCEHLPADQLHAVEKNVDGHKIVEWRGRRTFIAGMKPPTMRAKFLAVPHINNQPG